ncbi:hypothetical protein KW790_01375 [Candidatus Parcubacteria bacterium]|nr:hypothetical protein [Candidatus Parcubacteria bacterium]
METQEKGSKILDGEWEVLTYAVIFLDGIQIVFDFTLPGLNEVLDPFVGLGLAIYFIIRGVRMTLGRVFMLIGFGIGEEIPFVDALPFWTLEVLRVKSWDMQDKNS